MSHVFGARSMGNMAKLEPSLLGVLTTALAASTVDFGVPEKCWRTLEEQRAKVAAGVSKTMRSSHILQTDGTSHAVDVVPFIDGKFTWADTDAFYAIAAAVRQAALNARVSVLWGGQWDVPLNELPADLETAHNDYVRRFRGVHGRAPLIDLPHFQLA